MSRKTFDKRLHFIGQASNAGLNVTVANAWYCSLTKKRRDTTPNPELMTEFQAWLPTPVIFRADRTKVFEVTAVFPTLPACYDDTMTCYTHVGQHSGCSMGWYRKTRPATPREYASLKLELEGQGYHLEVCTRITPAHREAFDASIPEV